MAIWCIRRDPCGIFSAALSIGLLLYSQYVITTVILLPWYGVTLHLFFYTLITVCALYAHSAAQFQDPGAVPASLTPPPLPSSPILYSESHPPPPAPKVCRQCRTLKPALAFHCSTCERCVVRMDHHCPWVNNCVGINNQKPFILFLLYTALCCLYSGVLLVARFFSCSRRPRQCTVAGAGTALSIIDFVLCLVFGLFVVIMMIDQFSAIWEGNEENMRIYNHQMQQREAQVRSGILLGPAPAPPKMLTRYEAVCEVFGERFSYRWFLPFFSRTKQITADFDNELEKAKTRAAGQIKAIHAHIALQEQREAALAATNAQMRAAASATVSAANAAHGHSAHGHSHSHDNGHTAAAAAAAAETVHGRPDDDDSVDDDCDHNAEAEYEGNVNGNDANDDDDISGDEDDDDNSNEPPRRTAHNNEAGAANAARARHQRPSPAVE